jgi:hypothetical protein
MFFLVEIQSQIIEHIQRDGTSKSRNKGISTILAGYVEWEGS